MNGLVAEIALCGATFAFDKLYTYAVPPELHEKVKCGMRVTVPFGNGNSKKQGMVFSVKDGELKGLKKITELIDENPVLNSEMLGLCEYMKKTVFCTYYDAVSLMIPKGLGFKLTDYYSANGEFLSEPLLSEKEREIFSFLKENGEKSEDYLKKNLSADAEMLSSLVSKDALIKTSDMKRKMNDAMQKWAKLTSDVPEDTKLTDKQREVTNLLSDIGSASVKEICYFTGVSPAVIDGLVKKNIVCYFEKRVFRKVISDKPQASEEIVLTDEQEKAYTGLTENFRSEKAETALLYGVTGSGKTQVFLKLTEQVVKSGRGVIVMVPEIALTPQLISLFASRCQNKIAVFHSALSMGQRMDEWQKIKDGRALIAIGTRSAVFAPFKDLGLIIMDEEQEHTYKSEKTPRFHTRDIAKYRIKESKGLLCLASATPSVESFTLAKSGKYHMYRLKNRYGNAVLPEVVTVDMKKELADGNTGILSRTLYEEIKTALENKKQAIVLLNRRGHNTYVSCPACGNVATCPNCSISLTYHSANGRLMCHYCGYSEKVDYVCHECGNEHMKFSGVGTQKAEEELKSLFPDSRILRLDADSTSLKDSFENYLTDFANGEYDIMLGTQMVAKGLDFKNVTLVGVLGADAAAYSEDFRSFERAFSLLTQVVGRAGRGDNPGKAVIQTYDTESNLISLAQKQDYDGFYADEILTRKLMIYPPYCDICAVTVSALSSEAAKSGISLIFGEIKRLIENEYKAVKVIILGPSPAAVARVNNRYRFKMIIKCKNSPAFREMLCKAVNIKLPAGTSAAVDFNPETVI